MSDFSFCLRAERRACALLREMAERDERAVRKNIKSQPATSKFSDLGVTKTQSSRWQKLAALPKPEQPRGQQHYAGHLAAMSGEQIEEKCAGRQP